MTAFCGDCVDCHACGYVAYCLADTRPFPPCSHGRALCGDCNLEHCPDCRAEAEADMAQTGDYDPRVDPLYDHTAVDRNPAADFTHASGYDTTTNSYRRQA